MVQKSNVRSRRAEARRAEILRAAAKVFRRQGLAGAGMREIAAEADLSPGNLYHYFRSKAELLFFCQDRALDVMLSALHGESLSGGPVADRLRAVIRAHVSCLLDELQGSFAHLEVESLPDEMRSAIVRKRDRYERGIRRLIAAGARSGEFAACDETIVTRAILGALNWTARWYRPEGPRSGGAVAESLAEYLVRGLLPKGDDAPAATQWAGHGGT